MRIFHFQHLHSQQKAKENKEGRQKTMCRLAHFSFFYAVPWVFSPFFFFQTFCCCIFNILHDIGLYANVSFVLLQIRDKQHFQIEFMAVFTFTHRSVLPLCRSFLFHLSIYHLRSSLHRSSHRFCEMISFAVSLLPTCRCLFFICPLVFVCERGRALFLACVSIHTLSSSESYFICCLFMNLTLLSCHLFYFLL